MGDLKTFFNPSSVAVVGASNSPEKIGNAIMKNIISSGYRGKIFPVNPREKVIEGLTCYPSLAELKGQVETAVISVPASRSLNAVRECGDSGVKNLVVITAGFKEVGSQGLQMEKELVSICQSHHMNMLGPNCVGMMDTHTPINASFSTVFPSQGDIAFISQSGAMLVAILDWSRQNRLGFSQVISLGNKASLSEAHFIAEAAQDPNTRVILCYIEDVANGEHFLKAATRASAQKPVIILKSGTSQAGAQAASSHTGALAGSDLAYETAFKKTGVLRASSMSELFELAVAFTNQPVPSGDRVAVVTNAGGPGIITTDKIDSSGLAMARFSRESLDFLRQNLPEESSVYNPVDVLGDAGTGRYKLALEKVLGDQNVDSAVVLLCPTAVTEPEGTARVIVDLHRQHPGKPVFAAYMGGDSLAAGSDMLNQAGIPCFTFPETAIGAIAGMTRYSLSRLSASKEAPVSGLEVDKGSVESIFRRVKEDNRLVLLSSEASDALKSYGIPTAPSQLASSPQEAAEMAEAMGFPVVLKVASPKILHKTDVGGVKIGLKNAAEVMNAFTEINNNVHRYMPRAVVYGIEVQKMMPPGVEIIIGMTRDVQFGPLIAFGLGGIYVNLIKDVAFRLAKDITMGEIKSMIAETKAFTLLKGYRGETPADMAAVVDIVARSAKLVTDFNEITEMDINPVFVYPRGASALDIKITVS